MKILFFTSLFIISISIQAQWIEKPISISGQPVTNLRSMYFFNHNIGWIVGDATPSSQILKTIDGGETWAFQNVGSFGDLDYVYFVNESIGFAIGDNEPFLKTTDGGNNWISVPIIPGSSFRPSYLSKFHFITEQIGFYTTSNAIYKTIDSGVTWTSVLENPVNPITNIDFSNDVNNGIAVCFGGSAYKTSDSGETWQLITSFTTSYFWDISYSGTNIFIAGEQVFKSSDLGNTWSPISFSQPTPGNGYVSVTFPSASIGFCGGSPYEIYKSTDGGNSWNLQVSLMEVYEPKIQMINDTLGYVLADPSTGKFYKTINGGELVNSVSVFVSEDHKISVNPTFCNDIITIICDNSIIGSEYKIINQIGETVVEGKLFSKNTTINLNKLNSGNYYVITYGKQVKSTKIFKAM